MQFRTLVLPDFTLFKQVLALTVHMWSLLCKFSRRNVQGEPSRQDVFDAAGKRHSLDWYNTSLVGIERQARSHWLSLLIEWDRRYSVGKLLKGIKSNAYINKTSMNNALQVALEHDRSVTNGIVVFAFLIITMDNRFSSVNCRFAFTFLKCCHS